MKTTVFGVGLLVLFSLGSSAPLASAPELNALGVAYYRNHQLGPALSSFEAALHLDPQNYFALHNVGLVHKDLGNLDVAFFAYQRVLTQKPDFALAHKSLGVVYHLRANLEQARLCYEKAVALDPQLSSAWNNLGRIYEFEKSILVARDCFQRAWAASPGHPVVYKNFLRVQSLEGDMGMPPWLLDLERLDYNRIKLAELIAARKKLNTNVDKKRLPIGVARRVQSLFARIHHAADRFTRGREQIREGIDVFDQAQGMVLKTNTQISEGRLGMQLEGGGFGMSNRWSSTGESIQRLTQMTGDQRTLNAAAAAFRRHSENPDIHPEERREIAREADEMDDRADAFLQNVRDTDRGGGNEPPGRDKPSDGGQPNPPVGPEPTTVIGGGPTPQCKPLSDEETVSAFHSALGTNSDEEAAAGPGLFDDLICHDPAMPTFPENQPRRDPAEFED